MSFVCVWGSRKQARWVRIRRSQTYGTCAKPICGCSRMNIWYVVAVTGNAGRVLVCLSARRAQSSKVVLQFLPVTCCAVVWSASFKWFDIHLCCVHVCACNIQGLPIRAHRVREICFKLGYMAGNWLRPRSQSIFRVCPSMTGSVRCACAPTLCPMGQI